MLDRSGLALNRRLLVHLKWANGGTGVFQQNSGLVPKYYLVCISNPRKVSRRRRLIRATVCLAVAKGTTATAARSQLNKVT